MPEHRPSDHRWPVRCVDVGRSLAGPDGSGAVILRNCSLEVPAGTLTAIVGPSGAGKSSLLHCLSGLDRPDRGRAFIDDTDVHRMGREARARFLRSRVGFVFQQYNLIDYLSVQENVLLPHQLARRRVPPRELTGILEQFGLRRHRHRLAGVLSGGEQQRVALCRAMLAQPAIVFADEPTGALDTANSREVLRGLRDLVARGSTVVLVTHDTDAAAMADRVVTMRDGAISGVFGALSGEEIVARTRQADSAPPGVEGADRTC